jgi:hypothetical protein
MSLADASAYNASSDIAGSDGVSCLARGVRAGGGMRVVAVERGLTGLRIPMHRGHLLRFDRGQATDLMAATIPI